MQVQEAFLGAPAPLYYERLIPAARHGDPLVLVHGGARTGACYRCTPDGRPGWAHDFAAQGFEVVVPDWPGRGRSGYLPPAAMSGELIVVALRALLDAIDRPVSLLVHSMSGPYGFKLLETMPQRVRRLVAVAPGPPGNLQPLPEILHESDEAVEVQVLALRWRVPKTGDFMVHEEVLQAKLIGSGSRFPRQALDRYRASLTPLAARLLYERQNVRGSQLRLAEDVDFAGAPVLILTGTHDIDHPRAADEEVARWLTAQGARVDYVWLADRGISGNGHMLMLEDNSADLAALVGGWLRGAGG